MKQIKSAIQTNQAIRTTTFITLLMVGILTLAFISVPSFARDGRDSTLRERYEAWVERYRQNRDEDTTTQQQAPTQTTPAQPAQPVETQNTEQTQASSPTQIQTTQAATPVKTPAVEETTSSSTATLALAASRTGSTPMTPYVSDSPADSTNSSTFDSQITGIIIGVLLIVIAQTGPFIAKFAGAKYQQRTATVR